MSVMSGVAVRGSNSVPPAQLVESIELLSPRGRPQSMQSLPQVPPELDYGAGLLRGRPIQQPLLPPTPPAGMKYLSTSSNLTVDISHDNTWIDVDASGGAKTITLCKAAVRPGMTVFICKTDSDVIAGGGVVTIAVNGSDQVNGLNVNQALNSKYGYLGLVSTGTHWRVIAVCDQESTLGVTTGSIASSNTWTNITSLTFNPGIWDFTAQADFTANGAAIIGAFGLAISENTGNTTTDHSQGDNVLSFSLGSLTGSGTFLCCLTVASWKKEVTTSKTIYLKGLATMSSGSPANFGARLSARRVA
jgi:hypothetical protein